MLRPFPSFAYDALPGRVVFGVGAVEHLGEEVDRLGARRVLAIAGKRAVDGLVERLGDRWAASFTDVQQHVPVEVAARAAAAAAEAGADCLVALGGGSATGMAKAVALEHQAPIVAVPTTYAGSEVTPIYGLTGPEGKRTGRDPRVLPRTVIYDPALTTGLPAEVTGPSGMNALAHSVEALYAPGANPLTSVLAEEGARVLARGLPRAVADPADLAARSDALLGAWLAGSASTISSATCSAAPTACPTPSCTPWSSPTPSTSSPRPPTPSWPGWPAPSGPRTWPAGSGTWAASWAHRPAWPSSAWPRPSSTGPPPRPWPGSSRRRAWPG
jgi:alcohol dehydrogenase class IV